MDKVVVTVTKSYLGTIIKLSYQNRYELLFCDTYYKYKNFICLSEIFQMDYFKSFIALLCNTSITKCIYNFYDNTIGDTIIKYEWSGNNLIILIKENKKIYYLNFKDVIIFIIHMLQYFQ